MTVSYMSSSLPSMGSLTSLPGAFSGAGAGAGAFAAAAGGAAAARPAGPAEPGAARIETRQATSFAPAPGSAAAASSASADPSKMARLMQARKRTKGAAAKQPPGAKKTVGKPAQRKSAAAAAAAAEEKKAVGAWSKEEIEKLKQLVEKDGVGDWEKKAEAMGTGRTAKAVHTRWLRESGRIIDMPRGQQNMLNMEMTSMDVSKQQAILDQSGFLLPMLSGSLGAAFGEGSLTSAASFRK